MKAIMHTRRRLQPIFLIVAIGAATASQATSCMVVGDTSARVATAEGQKSPVFHTASCETLRLISGVAMVGWISRDGKPQFSPIAREGVARLPANGAEERSANVVWQELTSSRESQRPAFMRALDEERPARIYIPENGLLIAGEETHLRIIAVSADDLSATPIFSGSTSDGVLLRREQLTAGAVYHVEWRRREVVEHLKWKVLGADEATRIDQSYREIQENLGDAQQRRILTAMLFEQMKLGQNRFLALSENR